ncbi:azurin [Vibrio penaeicida]|uniref:azurin n=1 Tax=Vibrio penaeicida TaxID=104609 RepID=UPI002735EDED|nr:azurin [Vibrio penaeicida]MDP2571099.1 azurin [Vibrio penaeicida]
MKKFLIAFLGLFSFSALANPCQVTVEATDAMQFNTKAISVPSSCESFTVDLKHVGSLASAVMGHNWVLTETANFQPLALDSAKAGLDNNYVPPGDKRVLAATKIIGGGESTSVTFSTAELKGKDLTFFCSFPGHWAIMKGSLKVE